MTDDNRKKSSIPFVGLHGHSGFSLFDGFSFPADHLDFAYSNGLEGHAFTEHGNMNSFSYAWQHIKKMKKEEKKFKYIKGVEAYFIPSFTKWREQYEAEKEAKKETKAEDLGSFSENEEETKSSKPRSTINRKSHLVLLAKNNEGLTNLFKLVSKSFKPECFYRAPRIDFEMLKEHSKGLIIGSSCLGGLYASQYWQNKDNGETAVQEAMEQVSQQFLDIFGDDFYAELQWNAIPEQHEVNQHIIKVARKLGIKLISTADSHYPSPDAWKAREVYKRLNPAYSFDEEIPETIDEMKYELYPKNGDQMWESYKKYSTLLNQEYNDDEIRQSIEETYKIAFEKIEDYDLDTKPKLPSFITKGQDENVVLETEAWKGFHEKTKDFPAAKKKQYEDQLKLELSVIKNRGFAGYFLTTKSLVDYAREMMLVGLGRGSSAGSLLSYVLGITQVDPLRWGLSFARFMRKDQTDFPDIDNDFADNALLKEKLVERWGENSVVSITNWNTLKLKSTLKDLARFLGVPFEEVNEITKTMMREATPPAKKKHGITAGVYEPTYDELLEFSPTFNKFLTKYPALKEYFERILGEIKSAGAHAGGTLISENLDEKMPLIYVKGTRQTPWTEGQTVRHLEPLGFIKFDLLGLGTLGVIQKCIERILRNKLNREPLFQEVREWYETNLSPDVLNLEDQNVFKNIFHEGKWLGIFQFTEQGAQHFCKEAKPESIGDLSAITAIFRPGPLAQQAHKTYVDVGKGTDFPVERHPIIDKILASTRGILVFQEQLAEIAWKMGKDIDEDEANLLRKVLTKKGTGKEQEVKDRIYGKFLEGCVEKGMKEREVEELWKSMISFSFYAFNASHSLSYGLISYQCAHLATYYQNEWVCAFLDYETDKDTPARPRKEKAISLVRSLGYKVQLPDINTSGTSWNVVDGKLVQPFTTLKGLGATGIEEIMSHRPFKTIEDLLFHPEIRYSKLNKKCLDVLCRSGALKSLQDERFSGDKHFWSVIAVDRPKKMKNFVENLEKYRDEGSFSNLERISYQISLMGSLPLGEIVSDKMMMKFQKLNLPSVSELGEDSGKCWAVLTDYKHKTTRNGNPYVELYITDDSFQKFMVRCWQTNGNGILFHFRPYLLELDYEFSNGYSIRKFDKSVVLLG